VALYMEGLVAVAAVIWGLRWMRNRREVSKIPDESAKTKPEDVEGTDRNG
jgi:hypothetical protein